MAWPSAGGSAVVLGPIFVRNSLPRHSRQSHAESGETRRDADSLTEGAALSRSDGSG